jgi:ABC-type multidrug transport system fused ATPase/permease subunit
MKISEFKKLEQKINGQSFNQSYKTINIVLTLLSYFGHVASIFLAYFMLSKVLSAAMTDNPLAVTISSLIILSGIELLKRDIFDKFSIQHLKEGAFVKSVVPLFILSILVVSMSFYATISGAKEFSSKSEEIEVEKKTVVSKFKDSLTIVYADKVKSIEDEIKLTKSKIESKDKEQTDLEAIQPPTRSAKQRIKDLKDEKVTLRNDISKLEGDVNLIKTERDGVIKAKEEEISKESDTKKESNSQNSFIFILISTLIELVILAGVYFHEYYKFRSYKEFRDKIERDPNFQKWMIYEQILEVVYTEDTKMNQKLPSNKQIVEMCKINDIIVLPKDLVDFLKVSEGLGIIKSTTGAKYIGKQRDLAFEALKKHFNIQ